LGFTRVGLGRTRCVFINSNIDRNFTTQDEVVVAALISVAVLLVIAVGLLSLLPERYKQQVGWKAILALALGGFALAVPWSIAYLARM